MLGLNLVGFHESCEEFGGLSSRLSVSLVDFKSLDKLHVLGHGLNHTSPIVSVVLFVYGFILISFLLTKIIFL